MRPTRLHCGGIGLFLLVTALSAPVWAQNDRSRAAFPFPSQPAQPVPGQPLVFLVYGDVQDNFKKSHTALARRMAEEEGVSLILHTGDISNDKGEDYRTAFLPAMGEIAGRVPFFPSPGNHDVDWGHSSSRANFRTFFGAAFEFLQGQPHNGHLSEVPQERLWYALVVGETLFIVLDSNLLIDEGRYRKTNSMPPYQGMKESQLGWLSRTLDHYGDDASIRARFLFFHHSPVISTEAPSFMGIGGHPGHRGMLLNLKMPPQHQAMGRYVLDAFRVAGVNAVFGGHEHYYERWSEKLTGTDGSTHMLHWIVNGIGGVKPRGRPLFSPAKIGRLLTTDPDFKHYLGRAEALGLDADLRHEYPTSRRQDARFAHYVRVEVSETDITFQVKDTQGVIRDQGRF